LTFKGVLGIRELPVPAWFPFPLPLLQRLGLADLELAADVAALELDRSCEEPAFIKIHVRKQVFGSSKPFGPLSLELVDLDAQ